MTSVPAVLLVFMVVWHPLVLGQNIDITACIAQDWVTCGIKLGTTVYNLHNWSENIPYKIGPFDCEVSYKGRLHSWEWVWDGKFKCPGLSDYEAESNQWASRSGAAEHAMQEYFKNVHLTPEQLEQIKNLA